MLLEVLGVVVAAFLSLKLVGWFSGKMCKSKASLAGKTVVVTGANTGIGLETAMDFARRGASLVIMGCRDLVKAEKALERVRSQMTEVQVAKVIPLDLASLKSVKDFAVAVEKATDMVHVLVNNAGTLGGSSNVTADGFELHFGVNYLGHFYLTELLQHLLVSAATKCGDARIVNVSSDGHKFVLKGGLDIDNPEFGYGAWSGKGFRSIFWHYGQSKLSQIYHARKLATSFKEKKIPITAFSVHPGLVSTEITRFHCEKLGRLYSWIASIVLRFVAKTPYEGAQTVVYCSVDEDVVKESGGYFVDCKCAEIQDWLKDERKQEMLWNVSKEMISKSIRD